MRTHKAGGAGRASANSGGLQIAALFTAVILGAGFASGQELLRYFASYGAAGAAGLVLAGVLFALTGWAALDICRIRGITDYKGLLESLVGKKIAVMIEWLVAAFLLVLLAAMLAAAGAAAEQNFGLTFRGGTLLMAGLCLLVLLFDLDFLIKINVVLAPLMVICGVFLGLYIFFNRTAPVFAGGTSAPVEWIMAAVVYASYNMVTGVPVLASASRLVKNKKDARRGGLLGGAAMTLLGLCMILPLFVYYARVSAAEIPFMIIALTYGKVFSGLYLFLLVSAIFTTAVSNAYALADWLRSRFNVNRAVIAIAVCAAGVAGAQMGFSNIVGKVYPLFGVIGVFQIAVVLLSWKGVRKADNVTSL